MLELQGVSGGYNGNALLRDIHLKFDGKQLVSIIGPNGCGKSTLLRILSALMPPYTGRVLLQGREIGSFSRLEYARRVSLLPQVRSVPNMTVQSLVQHGRHPYLRYPRRYTAADKQMIQQAMEQTGAIAYRDRNLTSLSGGERQKAYIAMMIAQDTDIVLMDEPTTYLDIHHQFEIMELAKALAEQGRLVIMVLHDLNLALSYSQQVVVMQQGRVLACQPPQEVCQTGLIDRVFQIKSQLVSSVCGGQLLFRPQRKGEKR